MADDRVEPAAVIVDPLRTLTISGTTSSSISVSTTFVAVQTSQLVVVVPIAIGTVTSTATSTPIPTSMEQVTSVGQLKMVGQLTTVGPTPIYITSTSTSTRYITIEDVNDMTQAGTLSISLDGVGRKGGIGV